MPLEYGIVYKNQYPFKLPFLIDYGIPALFETEQQAQDFINKRKWSKDAKPIVVDKLTVFKFVRLIVEYFSGYRKCAVTDGKLVWEIDSSKSNFDRLHPINVRLYLARKKMLKRKKDIKEVGKFAATVKFKIKE